METNESSTRLKRQRYYCGMYIHTLLASHQTSNLLWIMVGCRELGTLLVNVKFREEYVEG
jgi:hypothetical protein